MNYEYYIGELEALRAGGNLRELPGEAPAGVWDLSSNDYLGLAEDSELADAFLASTDINAAMMTSSASRLLGPRQSAYEALEGTLAELYGRPALLFNSGYHANVGVIQTLADRRTLVLADKLIHASVIDGLRLAGAAFERFRHNDIEHLQRLIDRRKADFDRLLVVVESVYSMDGDCAPLEELAELKQHYPSLLLYVDEAHAVGVCGPGGLGLSAALPEPGAADIVVGTLGKALASSGAYAICSSALRSYFINKARSLIFSTALPPLQALWSKYIIERVAEMDSRREHLRRLATDLAAITGCSHSGHIQPLVTGSAESAVRLSAQLLEGGYKVLPIRTPTVPPGTERLRFSLSAALPAEAIKNLNTILKQ